MQREQRTAGARRERGESSGPGKKKGSDGKAADVAIRKMANEGRDARGPVRVLVTGYGPFMSVADNPSGEIAEALAKLKVPGAIIRTKVLPVTWQEVDAFVDGEVKAWKPDVVIGMGFSAGAHEIKTHAVNYRTGADAAGVEGGDRPITEGGPQFRETTLPVDKILEDQRRVHGDQGLTAVNHTEPDDAYLCNYIEYRELQALQNTGAMAGFLHISDVTRDLPAIETLLRTVVTEVQAQRKRASAVAEAGTTHAPPPDDAGA
jgi:pyroglutamyl-peptidase